MSGGRSGGSGRKRCLGRLLGYLKRSGRRLIGRGLRDNRRLCRCGSRCNERRLAFLQVVRCRARFVKKVKNGVKVTFTSGTWFQVKEVSLLYNIEWAM